MNERNPDQELEILVREVKSLLDIRDRKYGIPAKVYPACFVGNDAVRAMVAGGIAAGEEDAVRIGNLLLDAGVIRHVLDEHAFENKMLFYRFTEDEEHGAPPNNADGKAVSWADFLGAAWSGEDNGINLLPDLPPRDSRLGEFERVDLDTFGVEPLDEHNAALLDNVRPKEWIPPRPTGRYNLVVIGAGTGGLVAAAGSAGMGGKVALIESHMLGGDCLNVGCVPSKALLRCARAVAAVRGAGEFGVQVDGEVGVDFGAVLERMRRLRASISPNDAAERFARQKGVDLFFGRGIFTGRDTVTVGDETLKFTKAVIATGGTAAIPDIPGLAAAPYLTNATLFNLTQLPARLGIIGAGPIGLEMAQAFRRFGAEVTVMARGNRVLPKEDDAAAEVVAEALGRDGVVFETDLDFRRVESAGNAPPITVVVSDGAGGERALEFDALLVAAGRKPAVDGLGLEEAGIDFDPRLGISVNDNLRTTNPDVYAVGDVAGAYQFTHVADFMARIAVRNALFFGRELFSRLVVPWVTFTDPEVGHVGLYEQDLRKRDIPFDTFTRPFADIDRSILDGETEGFVKIHVKKGSDQILGATIVGAHAGDQISEVSVAIRAGMGLGKLGSVIHPYPTAAEAIRQCGDAYMRSRMTPTMKRLFNRFLALRR